MHGKCRVKWYYTSVNGVEHGLLTEILGSSVLSACFAAAAAGGDKEDDNKDHVL